MIGLIDSPIVCDHPDLAREQIRVLAGGAGDTSATPESFACRHGTLVAGVLHARQDSSFPGICPGCALISRSIFLEAPEEEIPNATVEELADAIIEVIGAGARVFNLSVGLAEQSVRAIQVIELALGQAVRHGVLVVVAAGNQGVLVSSPLARSTGHD